MWTDGAFEKSLLKKENVHLFLYLKEKGCKKKQTTLQVDGPVREGTVYRKARSLFAKAYLSVHVLLDERNFAAQRFFEEF